jgi:hypothetical protein
VTAGILSVKVERRRPFHFGIIPMEHSKYNLVKAGYSVDELTQILPIKRTSIYDAVRRGDLRPAKFGRRTFFLAAEVSAFLDKIAAKEVA